MSDTLYNRIDYKLDNLLMDIESGKLGLPDLQRPFVWKNTKVRELFDSMLLGYPIGYLMLWDSPEDSGKTKQISITPAMAEFTPYDYHIMYTANGNYVVYDFPDIMLYLPIEWEDAITVEQTDTGPASFQTASYDKFQEDGLPKGGFLFKLRTSEDESFREFPEYEYIGYSENAGLHFYLSMPSDYQGYVYDTDIRAEYDAMSKQIEEIAGMAKIHKSMHFYTDNIVDTDPGMS